MPLLTFLHGSLFLSVPTSIAKLAFGSCAILIFFYSPQRATESRPNLSTEAEQRF